MPKWQLCYLLPAFFQVFFKTLIAHSAIKGIRDFIRELHMFKLFGK